METLETRMKPIPLSRRQLLCTAAALVTCSSSVRGVEVAGDLLIHLEAEDYNPEQLVWPQAGQTGIPGDFFSAQNPQLYPVDGVPAVVMDGRGEFFEGPLTTEALHGQNVSHSVEMWVYQGNARREEAVISWSRRDGTDGTHAGFRYGSDARWGAAARWGPPDMGFNPPTGANDLAEVPALGQWHHLVFVYDSATTTQHIYVNGELNASEVVASPSTGLDAYDNLPINIGTERQADETTLNTSDAIPFSGAINRIRVHSGALSESQVASNYKEEAPSFTEQRAAAQVSRPPVHRYSFNAPAGAAEGQTVVPDLIGGLDATIRGQGANFTGTGLALPGGESGTQAYVDLPNGILSGKERVTIEMWVTQAANRAWSRFFDIGTTSSGEVTATGGSFTGTDYLVLIANVGDGTVQRLGRSGGAVPHGGDFRHASNAVVLNEEMHHVVTYDPELREWRWFRDGVLMEVLPENEGPGGIPDLNVWLGRSNFSSDQNFEGTFNEVRVYDQTLSESEIYGNFLAGPESLNLDGSLPDAFVWQPQTGGTFSWTQAGNWSGPGTFPNGADAQARLLLTAEADQTVQLNAAVTVNSLLFGSATFDGYGEMTIAPGTGGSLTFAGTDGAPASLYMPDWSVRNEISAPIQLATDTTVTNASVSGDPLVLSGTIGGTGGLTKNGASDLIVTGNSPAYAGDVQVNGGRLVLGDGGAGGSLGNAELATLGTGSIVVNRSGSLTFDSIVTGTGALTFVGPADVTFTGDVTSTGVFEIADGSFSHQGFITGPQSLRMDAEVVFEDGSITSVVGHASIGVAEGGTLTVKDGASFTLTSGNDFNVGDVGIGQSELFMEGGSIQFRNLYVGKNTGTSGVVVQTGGTLSKLFGGGDSRIGGGFEGTSDVWGAYHITGGSLTTDANLQIGAYGIGIMDVNGGDVTVTGGFPVVGRYQFGGNLSRGLLDVRAGTFSQAPAGNRLIIGETGSGVFNVRGTGEANLEGGLIIGAGDSGDPDAEPPVPAAPGSGVVNLHTGGTLATGVIGQNNPSIANGILNLHGGTLRALREHATFINNLDNAFVYPGGAVIDSNGFEIATAQALRAPTGSGVTTIPVSNGGSGYTGAPYVEITGGGGSGATAVAILDGDSIGEIVVTNPGTGYTSAPTVTLVGGGEGTGAAAGSATIAANASGGLTKIGAGTLTLNSPNSNYTGPTVVDGGTLRVNANLAALTSTFTVNSGGTLGGTGVIGRTITANGGTIAPGAPTGTLTANQNVTITGGGTLSVQLDPAVPEVAPLLVMGSLNLDDASLTVSGNGATNDQAYILATYGGSLTGTFDSVSLPAGFTVDYAYDNGTHTRNIAIVPGDGGGSAFENWASTYFGGETDPAIVGASADPDNDGATNLEEFAFGGIPNDPSNNGLTFVLTADSDDAGTEEELLLTVAVRNGAPAFAGAPSPTASVDGITYRIEGSTDLVDFDSAVTQVGAVTDGLPTPPAGYEYRTFRLDGSQGLPDRGFLRARVSEL